MGRYRLACIDFDKTLGSPHWHPHVSATNVAAVHRLKEAGIMPVLCSGRPYQDLLDIHRGTLGLEGKGPIIGCQGSIVVDVEGQVLQSQSIPAELIPQVLAKAQTWGTTVLWFGQYGVYVDRRQVGKWTDHYHGNAWRPLVEVDDLMTLVDADPPQKIIHMTDPAAIPGHLPAIRKSMPQLDWLHTDPENLEAMPPGIHKASAAALVASTYGFTPEQCAAFVDGPNDLEVTSWSGCGVCMGHAHDEVRRQADLVGPEGAPETAFARAVDLFMQMYVN